MKNHLIFYKSLACSAIIGLFLTGDDRASGKQLVYEKIDVQMTLNRDTSIDIVEHQQVRLNGDWNGLYRYYELNGCDSVEILAVYENDTPYQKGSIERKGGYILERKKGKLNVKWRSRNVEDPPYADAGTTFTVHYRVIGAVAQYRRRDVLFWKPLFHDHEHSIASAHVTLTLPEVIDPNQAEVIFYTKAPLAQWEIDPQNRQSINFIAKEVDLKDKFEIKVSIPKGLLEQYNSAKNRYTYNMKPWILPLGILGTAAVLLVFWYIFGRDSQPQPEQISDIDILAIPPGLAGLLINESFDIQDITATIIDLARRGYLHIKEIKPKTHLESGCWEFQLIQVPGKEELKDYEELLIQKLFSDSLTQGEKVNTNQLKNRFYKYIPEIEEKAWQEVKNLKWFNLSPRGIAGFFLIHGLLVILCSLILVIIDNHKITFYIVIASVFGIGSGLALVFAGKEKGFRGAFKDFLFLPFFIISLGVIITVYLMNYQAGSWTLDVGITGICAGILILMFGPAMGRKSEQGAAVNRRLQELRETLRQSKSMGLDFEDLIPWAIALGVTEDYLSSLGNSPPKISYYHYYSNDRRSPDLAGEGSMTLSSLANGFSAMTSSIGSALSSSPSSSGTGGRSGGGSGGGGGGGGGW